MSKNSEANQTILAVFTKVALISNCSGNWHMIQDFTSANFKNMSASQELFLSNPEKSTKQIPISFWEKAATTRWGRYVTEIEKRFILHGQSLAGKPGRALEVGCEGGRWTRLLSELGWEMTCTDVNSDAMEICRLKVPGAKRILVDSKDKSIPCASGLFSLALCIEVAPVIQSMWFLPEAARVLHDGGVLVCVVWNKASIRGWMHRRQNPTSNGGRLDYYKHNYNEWKGRLHKEGFDVLHSEGFCWGPFGRTSNSRATVLMANLERMLCLHRLTSLSPWVVVIARKVGIVTHGGAFIKESFNP